MPCNRYTSIVVIWRGVFTLPLLLCALAQAAEESGDSVIMTPWLYGGTLLALVIGWALHLQHYRSRLRKVQQEKAHAEHMKDNFLANISHEIRTPVNAIIGMSHLAMQTELTPKQYEYMDKNSVSAQALLLMLNDLLDFSKIEAGKILIERSSFSLDQQLEDLAKQVSDYAEDRGIELIIRRDIKVPDGLIGDPMRLRQILYNLINNAIKFSREGEVVFSIERLEQHEEKQVKLKFQVKDNGIGIEPERIPELFEPFVQGDSSTTRSYGGVGLGLTICKQLIELMGGTLEVESQLGKGSTFTMILEFGFKPRQDLNEIIPDPSLAGMRVLVVDDNLAARSIFREMLKSFQFSVEDTSSAQTALHLLRRHIHSSEGPFDLVLMDWRMPEMDGIEAAKLIKEDPEIEPKPAVIMITAYGRDELLRQANQVGLQGCLVKPVNPSQLFDTIITVVHGEREELANRPLQMEGAHTLSGNVLLVEDNPINQQVARELLESYGLNVMIAKHGYQALDCLRENPIDLVFMDIQMPEMDGYEATRAIRQQLQLVELPIIAMTAHAMADDKQRCFDAGMNDYLPKPIDPQRLEDTINKWLSGDVVKRHQPPPGNNQHSEADGLPRKLLTIDLVKGVERVGGNRKLFRKLLGDFYTNHHLTLGEIEMTLQQGDMETARRLAHTIQGVAGNIGAANLQHSGRKLEEEIRKGCDPISSETISDFITDFKAVFSELEGLTATWQDSTPIEQPVAVFSEQVSVEELLEQLAELLRDGDSQAIALIPRLQVACRGNEAAQQVLRNLQTEIGSYDFDDAVISLEKVARILKIALLGVV